MSKTQVNLSPTDISEKWQRKTKASTQDIIKGLNAVTEDPGQKAVDAQDKMKANLNEAIDNGSWANQRLKVGLNDWREKTKKKVTERLAGGVDAALPKRQKFDQWLVNRLNQILPEIAGMPDMTKEDSRARMNANFDHMSEEKYKTT